jgi:hypothetical protein
MSNTPIILLRNAQITQVPIKEEIILEILEYINKYRSLHQSPNLIWDSNICVYSQNWANYLLANKKFLHSGSSLYGENLAYFNGYDNDAVNLIKKSIDLWYNEIISYDFSKPVFSENTGHFTALIWKSSTNIGIGYSYDSITKTGIITMNTSPPGNIEGLFSQNVIQPMTPIQPVPTPVPVILPPAEPIIPAVLPLPSVPAVPLLPVIPIVPDTPVTPSPSPSPYPMPNIVSPTSLSNQSRMSMIIAELYKLIADITHKKSTIYIIGSLKNIIIHLLSIEL